MNLRCFQRSREEEEKKIFNNQKIIIYIIIIIIIFCINYRKKKLERESTDSAFALLRPEFSGGSGGDALICF